MRKISWICLTALLLSCILLLNACSFGNTLKLSKLFDESKFREPYVPTSATLISELNDATPVGSSYSYGTTLQLFSKDDGEYTKYMVYNVEIGKIVLTKTETEIRDYSISITEDNSLSPIIVVLTENYSSSEDDEADYTTTLYNADGTEIASAQGDKDYTMSFDMVYFDGKVYRLNEDSQFEYVFDYSPLAEFPNVIYKSGKYYLAGSDDCISAYNQELELVGTYVIPSYLQEDATAVALTDGKLFIQTLLELDAMATEFDILKDNKKYDMVTLLVNVPKGTAKEIDIEYYVDDPLYTAYSMYESYHFFDEDVKNLVYVSPIVNHRVDENTYQIATVKSDGDLQFLAQFEGMNIEYIDVLENGLYVIDTAIGTYLADEDFDLIADISNASFRGGHLIADGKVYDYNLAEVLDYKEEKLTEVNYLNNALLFESEEDELILVSKGRAITLIEKNADDIEYVGVQNGCIIIRDETAAQAKYKIYSEEGKLLLTLDYSPEFMLVLSGENAQLIRISYYDSEQGETVYRYYNFK